MNDVIKNIHERRSVRSYSEREVADEIINDIIRAGASAPTAMNMQGLRFVVVTDRETINNYSDRAKVIFIETIKKGPARYGEGSANIIKTLSNPDFNIFYNAPVLVLVYTHPSVLTPVEDASLAAENMMLAARSLGLGSCWIGFAKPFGSNAEFMKEVGVPADHALVASLIFGYPKSEHGPGKKNEPQILKWIR